MVAVLTRRAGRSADRGRPAEGVCSVREWKGGERKDERKSREERIISLEGCCSGPSWQVWILSRERREDRWGVVGSLEQLQQHISYVVAGR